jgi:hypothetical protein
MLAEKMEQLTGKTAYILPNMLDPRVWFAEPEPRTIPADEIVIGLSGSKTHIDDWAVMQYVLPGLLEKHPNVRLLITGFHPEYLKGLPRTEYLPAMHYLNYAKMVQSCDIILAPVDPNDHFNDSKSEIKTTEGQGARRRVNGMNAGAAVIATDNQVYRLGVQSEKTGLLVDHTPRAWSEALERLVTDTALRHRLQIDGHKWAKTHRNIVTGWPLWDRAYESIFRANNRRQKEALA